MTHAYDKVLLDRAADTLGRMLDYSAYSLHYDVPSIMNLFIASGISALFEHGDIRLITGMSGVELAYEVLDQSGIVFERMQPRYTKGLSAEYWCGHALAHIQWETSFSFDQILRSFSAPGFISAYGNRRFSFLDALPLNIDTEERSSKIKAFGRQFAEETVSHFISATDDKSVPGKAEETPLKKARIQNGLSQSGLAKASGVPLRTIQQYEQRQKDLNKARAEYLIALSRALNCDPAHLLSR